MNELLIVFLILLISVFMFLSIEIIIKADKKVLALNAQVTKFKETDFSRLKKVVAFFAKINEHVKLGKIKRYIEIAVSVISTINIIIVFKKIFSKLKKSK